MDLNTVIGFGVAVSVPVWLVLEEIASRRRWSGQVQRKARVASERFKAPGGAGHAAPGRLPPERLAHAAQR